MDMKLLFITNMATKVGNFSLPSIYATNELGIDFHIVANWGGTTTKKILEEENKHGIKIHHIDLSRNPLSIKNLKAFKQMIVLIKKENFEAIHCNTPIGGVLGRLCGKIAKVPKVIYTAHGFHFYKGAPLINRTIFKWAEKIMARYTDVIITMNQEDYLAAQKFKLRKGGKVYYIPGVGVNTEEYQIVGVDKTALKTSLDLNDNDTVMIAMGDLIPRKNYAASIKAVAKAADDKLHFLICGRGPELDELKSLAKELDVEKQIHFLGFRSDIKELLQVADIFLFTTFQEGLPRSMMEAMSAGLPCIASRIRGNTDLIEDGKGGFLFEPNDINGFAQAMNTLASNKNLRETMGNYNLKMIKKFDVENVKEEMKNVYINSLKSI